MADKMTPISKADLQRLLATQIGTSQTDGILDWNPVAYAQQREQMSANPDQFIFKPLDSSWYIANPTDTGGIAEQWIEGDYNNPGQYNVFKSKIYATPEEYQADLVKRQDQGTFWNAFDKYFPAIAAAMVAGDVSGFFGGGAGSGGFGADAFAFSDGASLGTAAANADIAGASLLGGGATAFPVADTAAGITQSAIPSATGSFGALPGSTVAESFGAIPGGWGTTAAGTGSIVGGVSPMASGALTAAGTAGGMSAMTPAALAEFGAATGMNMAGLGAAAGGAAITGPVADGFKTGINSWQDALNQDALDQMKPGTDWLDKAKDVKKLYDLGKGLMSQGGQQEQGGGLLDAGGSRQFSPLEVSYLPKLQSYGLLNGSQFGLLG